MDLGPWVSRDSPPYPQKKPLNSIFLRYLKDFNMFLWKIGSSWIKSVENKEKEKNNLFHEIEGGEKDNKPNPRYH